MKKSAYLSLLILSIVLSASAQENNKINCITNDFRKGNCRADFASYLVENSADTNTILHFVMQVIPNLQTERTTVFFAGRTESPAAYHYSFLQTFQGLPVYQSQIKVNVSKQNKVFSVFDNSYHVSNWNEIDVTDFDYQKTAAYKEVLEKEFTAATKEESRKVIAFNEVNQQPEMVYQVTLQNMTGKQKEFLVAKDKLLFEHDANSYFNTDSLVTGMVFNPDPLTSAHVVYGGNYVDNNDATNASLDAQLQSKNFKANFNGSVFSLENQYIQLADLDNNGTLPVTVSSPVFNYDRSQTGFEDVNAFYHMNRIRDYVNALGFTSANALVKADPHGGTNDNSFFTTPNSLYFGTGGVDDAEDADVVVHEYTHFISFNANNVGGNNSNIGSERQSVDEGTCDYIAASYSKNIDTYNWSWVYNWDGHNPFWNGRNVVSTKKYPQDLTSSIYVGGSIYATALMAIYDEIGKSATDSLVLQNMYSYASNQSLADASYSLLQADTLLFQGKYFCPIFKHLYERGLVAFRANSCGVNGLEQIQETNFVSFVPSATSFQLKFENENEKFEVRIFDRVGNEVALTDKEYYQSNFLSDGLYLVNVKKGNASKTFKWMYTK